MNSGQFHLASRGCVLTNIQPTFNLSFVPELNGECFGEGTEVVVRIVAEYQLVGSHVMKRVAYSEGRGTAG